MHIDGAPTKFQGLASFFIFWARIVIQKSSGKSLKGTEKSIAEIFENAVVKD